MQHLFATTILILTLLGCGQREEFNRSETIQMNEHPSVQIIDDANLEFVSVCLYVDNASVMAIGTKMNELDERAHMHGYNWEAVLRFFLKANHPQLMEGFGCDPEAGMFVAFYDRSDANRGKAKNLHDILIDLIKNEEQLYTLVQSHSDEIEWD